MPTFIRSGIFWFILFFAAPFAAKGQDTITICKDVRNITFTIFTQTGNAVAWQWTLIGGVHTGSKTDSSCGPVSYPNVGVFEANCNVTFSTGKDSLHRFIIKAFDGTVKPIPLRDTTICGNVNLLLDAGNSGNPIVKYLWTPGGQKNQTLNVNTAGIYGVSVFTVDDYSYNCNGCVACDSLYQQANVRLGARPAVNLGPDLLICNDFAVTLDAGGDGIEYTWSNGESSRTISTAIAGSYTVLVKNADGCTASDVINLKDSCPMYIFMPDAFTPDANNLNDVLKWVGNMKMIKFSMKVYNRWGQKVFETKDSQAAWDGFYKGKEAPEGVYAYLIECIDTNAIRHVLKGNITLLR